MLINIVIGSCVVIVPVLAYAWGSVRGRPGERGEVPTRSRPLPCSKTSWPSLIVERRRTPTGTIDQRQVELMEWDQDTLTEVDVVPKHELIERERIAALDRLWFGDLPKTPSRRGTQGIDPGVAALREKYGMKTS